MLREIFSKEMLESFSGKRMLIISILCCTLIPLSIVTNQRNLASSRSQQSEALSDYERSLEGQRASDEVEVKVFRSRPELSGLAAGLDPAIPAIVSLRQTGVSVGQSPLLDNPVATLFGAVDLLFTVKFVLSLAAIILTYNLICGERELGTLKLMLSNPVPRDAILLGKLLSALATILIPFILAFLGSVLALHLVGDSLLSSGERWQEILTILLASLLYIGVFVNLGVFVSTLSSRSLTAITILLVIWAASVTLVPQSAGLLAELLYPVESTESFLLRKSLAAQDLERQRLAELERFVRRTDYNEIRKPVAARYADRLRRLHARMDQDYESRRRTQQRIASSMALLSPSSSLRRQCPRSPDAGPHRADRLRGG